MKMKSVKRSLLYKTGTLGCFRDAKMCLENFSSAYYVQGTRFFPVGSQGLRDGLILQYLTIIYVCLYLYI